MSNGRRVVVTAGAAGIGLAIAKAFAADGDRVHICDINEQAVEQVTDDNPAITGTVCDVSSRSSVEAFVQDAVARLGGIDVLVNNAGIAGPTASVEEMDPDQWDAVLAVNLTGTFNVTRLSMPLLKKSDAGVVIIMSSVGGRFGYPDRSPYATTKRGLIGLTETLALELAGDGIRVNAIAPGAVVGERIRGVLRGAPRPAAAAWPTSPPRLWTTKHSNASSIPTTSPRCRCSSRPTAPSRSPGRLSHRRWLQGRSVTPRARRRP